MTEELLKLETRAQHCAFTETDSSLILHDIIEQMATLVRTGFGGTNDAKVIADVLQDLEEAADYLHWFKPETININDWKFNLQAFSKAKAGVLYSLNRLQSAIRFGKLLPVSNVMLEKQFAALEQ